MRAPLLAVRDLRIGTADRDSPPLISGIGFEVGRGETVALVGESGSGKSLTALSLLRLLPDPPVSVQGGSIRFEGRELTALGASDIRDLRGGAISMIFQEPLSALNPTMTIGTQLLEAVRAHTRLSRKQAAARVLDLLDLVRMPDPARRLHDYPHRLSGGMRQRILIAMAMAGDPRLLIADEPTTALDVTVQADILDTLQRLQSQFGLAILLITHDFGLVADYAEKVVVLYAGRQIESGPVAEILARPAHPYTKGLLGARPETLPPRRPGARRLRLAEIPGTIPSIRDLPPGCPFSSRCAEAIDPCRHLPPPLFPVGNGHLSACLLTPAAE